MFVVAHTNSVDAIWRKKTASLLIRVRGSSNSILNVIPNKHDSPLMLALMQGAKSLFSKIPLQLSRYTVPQILSLSIYYRAVKTATLWRNPG
ncbi:hypothetical protein K1T71_001337 [Dendrolimus kikuchii]|uniref:Uncharacterized protein n=1 Tax=Dendrolimus kikuchii TaxID=765133 RepID=A0ACC1DJ06_9NEOP|nr:hypothetical protein K1T71_001337 [Dendrolimus kikuchii]